MHHSSPSSHKVEVVRVYLQPHPDADTLSIVRLFDGYTVVVRTADWHDGQLGAYIPPDSVVDREREEFAFLGAERVKVRRLRGVWSQGVLIPAPAGAREGDDVAELLGVVHYEPPVPLSTNTEDESPPPGHRPSYHVESLRRYAHVLQTGEFLRVTEKVHGASGRWCWSEGRMRCGSRTTWKREDNRAIWWQALRVTPAIEQFCRAHEECTVYGEVYGSVQDLRYGCNRGEVRAVVFDIYREGHWVDAPEFDELCWRNGLPAVPVLMTSSPATNEELFALAEGSSLVPRAKHVREGIVVKPVQERWDPEVGRVIFKAVGNGYLERA